MCIMLFSINLLNFVSVPADDDYPRSMNTRTMVYSGRKVVGLQGESRSTIKITFKVFTSKFDNFVQYMVDYY